MSTRNTIALVAVLAALCLGYWYMIRSERSAIVENMESKRLFEFNPADIESLTLSRKNEAAVTGERRTDGWTVTAPTETAANDEQWEQMATVFAGLVSERNVAEAGQDLAPYGFDEPRLTVTAQVKGREVAVQFGKVTPTQDYRYARLGDGPVFLTPDGAYKALDRKLIDLRDRMMIRAGKAGVTRIEFSKPTPPKDMPEGTWEPVKVIVEKRDDGRWYMLSPVEGAADQEMVGNLAAALQMMPGRDFVDYPANLQDYQLDPPRAQITAWTGKGSAPQTVLVGALTSSDESADAETGQKAEQGVFVKRADSPSVFVVPAGLITVFPATADSYRDMHLLTHLVAEIQSLHYRTHEADVVLDAGEKEWALVQPKAEAVDQQATSAFIALMKSLRGKDFTSDVTPEQVLDSAVIRFDLTLKSGKTVTLAISEMGPAEGGRYALQDTGSVMVLEGTEMAGLLVRPFAFRAKDIYKFEEDKAARLVLHFEGVDYAFERNDAGEWIVQSPAGKRWEVQSDMDALLKNLKRAQAVELESETLPEDLTPYGLDAPVLTAEVTIPSTTRGVEDTRVGPLRVGQPAADDPHERYATVAGKAEIYRVSQSLIDGVREALRGIRDR